MSTWAIVPVKPFYRSKSRLAEVLAPGEREALSRSMLEHTLELLTMSEDVQGILVVTRDPSALAVAREFDAQTVQESGSPELNAALTRASGVVKTWGAKRVFVLPSDLPLLTLTDIQSVLKSGPSLSAAVIAPDRREDGTNALVMRPPGLFEFAFGPGSFADHVRLATQAGAAVREYRSATLALDVDLPEDLALYREMVAAE